MHAKDIKRIVTRFFAKRHSEFSKRFNFLVLTKKAVKLQLLHQLKFILFILLLNQPVEIPLIKGHLIIESLQLYSFTLLSNSNNLVFSTKKYEVSVF